MSKSFDHKAIEKKWQRSWEESGLYRTSDSVPGKENFYTLVELPYPSGDLHVGHWYAFSVPDIFARMKRMQGKNVLYPIGFDAFGLPAENAAIKHNVDPGKWTYENIDRMRGQLKSMGASFDWEREIIACDPSYYRFTQWLFLKLYEKGLAYKGTALVNWDPVDKTVLANEQVLPDGTAERSGAKVEKKELAQWFMKITAYADRLIDDLTVLDWPESIKESQKNWIGRSEGALLRFEVRGDRFEEKKEIEVFTTRPDTLFGATYLVLAPEHPLLKVEGGRLKIEVQNAEEVVQYIQESKRKSEIERQTNKEKTGVRLEGVSAVNPATHEEIPVYVADYVLAGYGTGAIMAVPAHDERDHEFAVKCNLPIRRVIESPDESLPYGGEGVLVNSGVFSGLHSTEARVKIREAVKGKVSKTYKIRDWLISRQRYWGSPIPIVYDPEGKPHPIPEHYLPWVLPTDVDFTPTGEAPLARSKELRERTEKLFGAGWTPETDTMDTFVESSWYFLRYLDPKNEKEFASLETQKAWMPVNRYSGGSEHTTVHVLYSRFLYKALFDLGLVHASEPYARRMNRGIILAEDGRKMSKRWGNVVNPDEQVANVGADSVRTYLAFIGPYNEVGSFPWSTNGLVGVRRFLERVYGLMDTVDDSPMSAERTRLMHSTIKKVTEDIESMKFNTAVSALMIFSNEFGTGGAVPREGYECLLKLLAPFAPHLTEEVWSSLGHTTSIHREAWPMFDEAKLVGETVSVAVQVGGKTKGVISLQRGMTEEAVCEAVRMDPKLEKVVPQHPKRVIFVPDKIINFVP